MRYIRYKATAKPGTKGGRAVRGAYVSCWIKRRGRREAIAVAKKMIRDYGWLPVRVEAHHLVTREGYMQRRATVKFLKCFDQACLDREVLVFHTWPRKRMKGAEKG